MDLIETITPIWKVLAVGILLGAGLPAIFAIGMRLQSPAPSDGTVATAPAVARRVAGIACFVVVVVAVLFGLAVLVGGDGVLSTVGLG